MVEDAGAESPLTRPSPRAGRRPGRLLIAPAVVVLTASAAMSVQAADGSTPAGTPSTGATTRATTSAVARTVAVPITARRAAVPSRRSCARNLGMAGRTPRKEALLSEWAQRVTTGLDLDHDPQYVIMGLDYRHDAVDIHYHGPLPSGLARLRRQAARAGVTLTRIPVRYGTKHLDAATDRLFSRLKAAGIWVDEIAEGTPCGGIAAGLTVLIRPYDATIAARVLAIAARVVPDVDVHVARSHGPAYAVSATSTDPTSRWLSPPTWGR